MSDARLAVIRRALEGIESLPPRERAHLLEGAGHLLRPWARAEAEAAFATALAIRSAEDLQLNFSSLLRESRTQPLKR